MDYKNVWQKPFINDGWGYIWSANRIMVFTFDYGIKEEIYQQFTDLLNGEGDAEPFKDLHIEDGCELFWHDAYVGSFRGWGHLTGTGGLNLSEEEAAAVQDDFIRECMESLTKER